MSKKNMLSRIVFFLSIFLFQQVVLCAEVNSIELKKIINKKDQSCQLGYKICFLITTNDNPYKDTEQGMIFMNCESTWTEKGYFATKLIYDYEHPPVFAAPKSKNYRQFDYDEHGNLVVWRTLEEYALATPVRNDVIKKVRVFFVDPNNKIINTGDNIIMSRFPIDKPYNLHQFKYYLLSFGRGFSGYMDNIKSIKNQKFGKLEVLSEDYAAGKWEFIIEPNSDYLVRKAVFTGSINRNSTVEIITSGILENDGVKFAKYGQIKHHGIESSLEIINVNKIKNNNKLYEEVNSRMSEKLPKGASIVDMRDEKPTQKSIGVCSLNCVNGLNVLNSRLPL